ncbi:MAG: YceI family protein [Cyclobacteriaceae bacterium]|nr:YceI family protein [Cyclobacteriaceae bacterium]
MDKIRFLLVCSVLFICHSTQAQKFTVEKSTVIFFSKATVEDIKADNTKLASIFNTSSGEVAFSIPIKDFEFEKALMKEHFNEKYLETEKFAKATFQGKLLGYSANATGVQPVSAIGKLTIHGITKEVTIEGTLENVDGKINAKSKFNVKLEDYKIKIPQLLWQNIAEQVEVTIDITYKPL